jgi:hypothetical protein
MLLDPKARLVKKYFTEDISYTESGIKQCRLNNVRKENIKSFKTDKMERWACAWALLCFATTHLLAEKPKVFYFSFRMNQDVMVACFLRLSVFCLCEWSKSLKNLIDHNILNLFVTFAETIFTNAHSGPAKKMLKSGLIVIWDDESHFA